ncbi:DUF7269 family protein [Haladaptatus sp.]|uniref:DUF7269 family protein n=1 Tax=Haladaptatus sp. TaxID=1973141 RepID=UPI003C4B912F
MMRLVGRAIGRAAGHVGRLFRTDQSRERILLAAGVVSLTCAFLVVFVPQVVPEATVRPLVGWIAKPMTIFLLAGAGGVLAIWSLKDGVVDEREVIWQPRTEPEKAHFHEQRTTGSDVDDGLRLSEVLGIEARERRSRRATARRHVRRAAIETLRAEGDTKQEAAERLEAGSWTDDPRAAAFLGASNASIPLRTRINDWARGETFDRRAERAVSELRTRNGGESR